MSYFLLYTTIAISLTSLLIILGNTMPVRASDQKKIAPYECGFDPIKSARSPFSFRFFMVAILFLIFDLEIALLLITPFLAPLLNDNSRTFPVIIFIIILILGL